MTSPSVLLVDDDEDYLHIARRAVRREKVHVDIHVVHNGVEALRWLGLDSGEADARVDSLVAIFLDLNMPGMDGYELLSRIRSDARICHLPVVVVSSSARTEDMRKSYDLGANSFVVKEFDPTGPGRYLALAVRYWTGLNRVPSWTPIANAGTESR